MSLCGGFRGQRRKKEKFILREGRGGFRKGRKRKIVLERREGEEVDIETGGRICL